MAKSTGSNRHVQNSDQSDQESDFIKTTIPGMDDLLLGGVRKGNILLIEGAAGTGKTTAALAFVYHGAKELGEPGVIVSFELSPEKLRRDAHRLGWDFKELEDQGLVKIIYASPMVILQELAIHDGVLATEIDKIGAKRFVLDGLTPLKIFGELVNGRPFRDSLHLLIESLQRIGVTAVLTRELPSSSLPAPRDFGHEEFVCDTVVTLSQSAFRRRTNRNIEITKSRGQDYVGGRHTMRIVTDQGIRIYPRPQARLISPDPAFAPARRYSCGIRAVDEMLGGGLYEGSITLTAGISGTGKTVKGIQFLMEGLKQGQKGLLISLDEQPSQLVRNAESLGFEARKEIEKGNLFIHYDSPLEIELDVHFHDIIELIEKHDIKRVVIDSLADYEAANPNDSMEFIHALATHLKSRLITAYFNYESQELIGISQISANFKASPIVDNIILLSYVEISTRLRRAITVPKAKGGKPDHVTREFVIKKGGLAIIDDTGVKAPEVPQLPFSSYYGLLGRNPLVTEEYLLREKARSFSGSGGAHPSKDH